MDAEYGSMLVVDDVEANRELLSRRLRKQGHTVTVAENGRRAINLLQQQPYDIVLCDIMMPEMDGFQVLEQLKADPALRHIPVIMISALDDIESVVRCIELGAEDYLFKPFNPTLLRARIGACLEKKRLRDQEQAYLKQIQVEQEKSERLLLSILPKSVAEQLKQEQQTIAESFTEATVLFADIVDFTQLSSHRAPIAIVSLLNEIFSAFDHLADLHRLEKIKTIGDAYMVVGGIPTTRPDHAEAIAEMALDMQDAIAKFNQKTGESISLRLGISTGPVVAGVIGTKKFIYDLWGDTVNTASRMESQGISGSIQVTEATYQLLHTKYQFQERGVIDIKGKGEMRTYLLRGR
ncbi:MAG: response regulator [Leptolyngbyaceae cyanobacterium RU_5_1]|nr:response regulator [Leptolyngbyaceae cyanobacterium RU_5_1]